jgi:hypothetical protein
MRHLRSLALCCATALAAAAHAQSLDGDVPASTLDPYAQGTSYGSGYAQGAGTRSIFLGTIAALIAQGVGSGIGNALAQGLGGSITRWFGGDTGTGRKGTQQALAGRDPGEPDESAGLQAGVAYEVDAIGRDGSTKAVDPARHVFRTGDRFQVFYRTTLPGRVRVFNIDPRGSESRIDSLEVAAGQLVALGPYQFVDGKGAETLKLVLAPCSSQVLTAATRAIVKAGTVQAAADPALRISDCGDAKLRGLRSKTRSIRKTSIDGSTVFALDPMTTDEISTGRVDAREVRIALQHR